MAAKKTAERKEAAYAAPQNVWGTGKRKRAIARAYFRKGGGRLKVNSRSPEYYLGRLEIMKVKEPFLIAGGDFSGYDINVSVRGGGRIGQAEAIKVAIASGMAKINPSLAAKFLAYDRNLLVADPRRTEPHKPPRSSKGARRHKQRSKR